MYKLTGILFLFLAMVLNTSSAKAAVTDCHPGCEIALQDDGAHFYNKLTGAEEGVIGSIGTGNGTVSTGDDGYSFVTRGSSSGILWILDAKTGGSCNITIGPSLGPSLQFGNDTYTTAPGADTVAKNTISCTGGVGISVGDSPAGMATDGTTIYVVNSGDGTISTIVPPAETATTYGIGRSGLDYLSGIKYNAANNKLYVTGLAGVYEVDLPLSLGTSVLWQALPNGIGKMSRNNNYFSVNDLSNDMAYLVEIASPSTYNSIPCTSCTSADLSDDTLFTTGGGAPDVGIKAWTLAGVAKPFSPLTTTNTWSSAYLPPFTPPAAVCQNGVQETGEECDQGDFGTSTCGTEGFEGGSLSCSASCTIVNTACTYVCGNNSAAITEECDGTDLKSQDCTTLGMGFTGGTLACNSCTYDTSSCTVAPTCNDGNIDAGEDCDGANLDGADCQSEGYQGGTLSCTAGCAFDYSGCSNCGNNTADTGEACDGADLNSQDCISQGFDGGTLACSASCTFDIGSCVLNDCGDGVLNTGEACDDGNNINNDGCSNNCQGENGWVCSSDEPSICTQICGNGNVDTGEECDGSNLDNATCADFGGEGDLTCKSDCTLDTTGCLACNDPQLIYDITINDVDQTQLNGHNAELFNTVISDLTEASGDRISCGDYQVAGQTVPSVVVSLNAEEYKLVRISGNGFTSDCLFFSKTSDAKLYVNITDPKKTRIDNTSTGTGLICVHSGENVQFQVGGLLLGTLGTAFSLQYLTFNPKAQQDGSWAELFVSNDGVNLLELDNPLNNGDLFVTNFTDGAKYVNLNAYGDLSEIGRKPTEPNCNCSTTGPGAVPPFMLVLFFMLWSWRRSRQQSLQQIEFKSRDR